MASSSALSFLIVSVRRGARLLVPNTAIKSNSEETYSDLFERVQCSQSQVQGLDVDDVIRVRLYDLRKTSADIVVESMDLPLSVGDDVGLKGVEFHLQERHGGLPPLGRGLGLEDSTATGRNAFDMLMTIRHEVPAKVGPVPKYLNSRPYTTVIEQIPLGEQILSGCLSHVSRLGIECEDSLTPKEFIHTKPELEMRYKQPGRICSLSRIISLTVGWTRLLKHLKCKLYKSRNK